MGGNLAEAGIEGAGRGDDALARGKRLVIHRLVRAENRLGGGDVAQEEFTIPAIVFRLQAERRILVMSRVVKNILSTPEQRRYSVTGTLKPDRVRIEAVAGKAGEAGAAKGKPQNCHVPHQRAIRARSSIAVY